MKKRIFWGSSVILLLTILIFTSPAQAADYAGHNFSEDSFAVEIDLVGSGDISSPDPANPDVIYDFTTNTAGTDSNEEDDIQFFMAYMNDSGIEVAYSALEKLETVITLEELLPGVVITAIESFGTPDQKAALDEPVFDVNATAPFQQLVQHFNTPWGSDAFVVNNYMSLIAYSSNETDRKMDPSDDLYLGYTFSVQALIDGLNTVLDTESLTYDIDPYNYEASFSETSTGYNFEIKYDNMFVVWQKIDIEPSGIDIVGAANVPKPQRGIVYGMDIVAVSVFDHITFEYTFETEKIDLGTTPPIEVILGNVTTQYHFGETNFLATKDSQSWFDTHAPFNTSSESAFAASPSYTFNLPSGIAGATVGSYTFPSSVNVNLPPMALYTGDDAKLRMWTENSFGLTVATATNWFDVKVTTPQVTGAINTGNPIELEKDGNTFFWTSFQNKDTYTLTELSCLGADEPATSGHHVIVTLSDLSGWAITGVCKAYFIVEFALAFGFTVFFATKVSDVGMPGTATVLLNQVNYFTFTEFPEWYGGEIVHDPAYSAVAAVSAVGEDGDGDDDGGGVPGFEAIPALLALPSLYAIYRRRRK